MPPSRPDTIRTALADGTALCIRRVRPDDEGRLREGIARMSPRSRYLRFFTGIITPPPRVIDRLLDADGHAHIAWGAIAEGAPGEPAVGIVHAYGPEAASPGADNGSDGESDCAEFSVAVLDEFHGRGVGRLLTATILIDARREGYEVFRAWTLAENAGAIAFIKALGARLTGRDAAVYEYELDIDRAIETLRETCDPPGLADVFAAFDERGCAGPTPRSGTPPAP